MLVTVDVLELQRVVSKVANFNISHLHLVPPLGVTPYKFC